MTGRLGQHFCEDVQNSWIFEKCVTLYDFFWDRIFRGLRKEVNMFEHLEDP